MHPTPRTPTRRRHSDIDDSFTSASQQSASYSPQSNGFSSSQLPFHSRQSSLYSIPSPSIPRPISSGTVNGFDSALASGSGLGNLADELAEAWDDDAEADGEDEQEISYISNIEAPEEGLQRCQKNRDLMFSEVEEPFGIASGLPDPSALSEHRRKHSRYNNGFEDVHGFELEGVMKILPSLEVRMNAVESLVRLGAESNGGDADKVVQRVADFLRELGSQSSLEQSVTRLTTTHTALTTHIMHQTRLLQNIIYPLLSPLSIPPPTSFIDELLQLLTSLRLLLPAPNPKSLSSMLGLHSSTADLISTLSALSDSLHMARQTSSTASRRLQAAREMVDELRREAEVREEGVRWVEKGRWDDRLAARDCARVCGEVVGGFEEVCKGWREKLATGGIEGSGGVEVGAG